MNWKKTEMRVARFFGVERTPLSGGNSRITRSDTLHPALFVEVKSVSGTSGTNGWIWRWLASAGWPRGLMRANRTLYAQYVAPNGCITTAGPVISSEREIPEAGRRLYNSVQALAIRERKYPLLALVVKGKHGFWLVGQAGDLLEADKARAAVVKARSDKDDSLEREGSSGAQGDAPAGNLDREDRGSTRAVA